MPSTHSRRLQSHLDTAQQLYPHSEKMIKGFRDASGDSIAAWPAWCFLPWAAWHAIVRHHDQEDQSHDVARLAAIDTWRHSRGIYRLSDTLQSSCMQMDELQGACQISQLYRLPEWCVYIQTPELDWGAVRLMGFFAHLDWDPRAEQAGLRLLMDTESGLLPFSIPLVEDCLKRSIEHTVGASDDGQGNSHLLSQALSHFIAMLLCLCQEQYIITDAAGGSPRPLTSAPLASSLQTPKAAASHHWYTVAQPGNAVAH